MTNAKIFILFLLLIGFNSCGYKTNNADKAFKAWTEIPLTNTEAEPLAGNYTRSAHFSYEYEVMLTLKASQAWVDELIEQNGLELSESRCEPHLVFNTVPSWFAPSKEYSAYRNQNMHLSLYLWKKQDSDTIYIFDQQL